MRCSVFEYQQFLIVWVIFKYLYFGNDLCTPFLYTSMYVTKYLSNSFEEHTNGKHKMLVLKDFQNNTNLNSTYKA